MNINIPRFLLKDAASELTGAADGPLAGKGTDFADLIKDVKLIRLVVIEANSTNRPALDKAMKTLRADLEAKWTPIVSVPEDHVGIYAMGDPSGESMAGFALLVYDDGDAVIGNVVGRVSIGKVIKIASQLDNLPPDLLKKLQTVGAQMSKQSAPDSGSAKPAKAAETPDASSKEPAAK